MCEYSIPDERLRAAARKVRDAMLSSLPEPSECSPDFSAGFTQSMEVLIRKAERKARKKAISRFTAALLALIVIGSGIWLAADTRAYADFQKWVRNTYENTVIYRFFSNTNRTSLPECTFGWLPDGYTLEESVQLQTSSYLLADNASGETIYLIYQSIKDGNTETAFGEGLSAEEIELNNMTAMFYYDQEIDSENALFWIDDDIALYLTAQLSKDDLVQIAENLQK